jgi:hypothetical protein
MYPRSSAGLSRAAAIAVLQLVWLVGPAVRTVPVQAASPAIAPALAPESVLGDVPAVGNAAGDIEAAVGWLNAQRQATGAPPVTVDQSLSDPALLHANYLAINKDNPAVAGLLAHDEDLSLPGATPEGKQSAGRSHFSQGHSTVLEAVQALTYAPFHRVGMLDPQLRRVGVGAAEYSENSRTGLAVVFDVGSAIDRSAPSSDKPAVYPVPGQRDVPPTFDGNEFPDPRDATPGRGREVGFIMTVEPSCGTLSAPREFRLRDEAGRDVPVWTVNPGTTVSTVGGSRVVKQIMAFSQEPLENGTTYRASVSGACVDKSFSQEWSFTTAGPKLTVHASGEYVVKVPEQLDLMTATDRFASYTDTQRERGVVLVLSPGVPVPEDTWKRLFGWKVRVEMADGSAPNINLYRPTGGLTWPGSGGLPIQNYEGGPQFAEVVAAKWPTMFSWGPPTKPVTVEGREWVVTFGNGAQLRWTLGAPEPKIVSR